MATLKACEQQPLLVCHKAPYSSAAMCSAVTLQHSTEREPDGLACRSNGCSTQCGVEITMNIDNGRRRAI